jgi:glycosyltransferase involved in cell wall biosynthesis
VAGIHFAKKLKVPCIVEVRDLWPESIVEYMRYSKRNPIIQVLYCLERWIYKKADRLIFTMEGGADYIREKGWDKSIDMTKIFHINNGVDVIDFSSNAEKNQIADLDLDDVSHYNVVYAGSIRMANGIDKLLDAAQIIHKKNPSIRFLIWGDGEDFERLQQRIAKEDIENVIFKGRVSKAFIAGILRKSALNILHYHNYAICRFGGSQNKLFEYFASGKPVLSTIRMGYDLITRYGAGVSLDAQQPKDIVDAVLHMASLPKEEYDRYCENARKAAMDYDYKNLTAELISVLEGVVPQ